MGWVPSSSKRSQTVSLVLVVGAGVAALALGRRDPSQREEDMLVYGSLDACLGQGLRSAGDCEAADGEARGLYPRLAPRYPSRGDCEAHHGCAGCTEGGGVSADAAGSFVPVLSGFMLARNPDQGAPVQPLFRHETRGCTPGSHAASGGGHSYCTASGGRVWATGSGSGARVSLGVTRSLAATPRTVSSGGFGSTGRVISGGGRSGGS
ncbi:MAG: DUF1190 domain-containing protein [Methylobacterium frigidaeris]